MVITAGQPLPPMVSPEDDAAEADDAAQLGDGSSATPCDGSATAPIESEQQHLMSTAREQRKRPGASVEKPRRRFTELRYRTLKLPTLPENPSSEDMREWYTKLFKEDPMRYSPSDRQLLADEQRRCFNRVWDKSFYKEEEDLLDGFESDVDVNCDEEMSTQTNTNTDSEEQREDDGNILDPAKLPRIFEIPVDRLPHVIPNNGSVITGNAENWLYLQKTERDSTLPAAQRVILRKANKEAKNELWKLTEKLLSQFHSLYGLEQRVEFQDCCLLMEWVLQERNDVNKSPSENQRENLEVLNIDIQTSRKELYILEFIMEQALIINNLAKVHQFVITNCIEDDESGKLLPEFIKTADISCDF
uniref:Condensin-2 complex subunit H2 n=1 Tax=Steinernema glaseri TaxID=37863 RepID=A0A1I7ZL20_9BILA